MLLLAGERSRARSSMKRRHATLFALTMTAPLGVSLACSKRPAHRGKPPAEAMTPAAGSARAEDRPRSSARAGLRENACRGEALPADRHFVAEGLCATVVATKQGKLRDIDFLPNGDLIGVKAGGEIIRYRDVD